MTRFNVKQAIEYLEHAAPDIPARDRKLAARAVVAIVENSRLRRPRARLAAPVSIGEPTVDRTKPREAEVDCSPNGHGSDGPDPNPNQPLVIGGGQFKMIGITLMPGQVVEFEVLINSRLSKWKRVRGKVLKNNSVNCSGVGDDSKRLLHGDRRRVVIRRIK